MIFRFLIKNNSLINSIQNFQKRHFKMTEMNLCYTKYDKNRLKIIG